MTQQPQVVLRQQWQLQRLIGRVNEQRQLEQILTHDIPARRGRTVVITGPLGSGKAALARFALWESLRKLPRSVEIDASTGKMYLEPQPDDTQGILQWESKGEAARRAYLGDAAQRLPFPIGTIVAVLNSLFPEAQQQGRKAQLSTLIALPDLPLLVTDVAGTTPFALHITGLDSPTLDSQWMGIVAELVETIHNHKPVLLLISMESSQPLMMIPEYQATSLQLKVRELVNKGMAQNWHLGPVSKADVAHYVHEPADDFVIDQLHVLSGGWPLMVQALWRDWRNSAQKVTGGGDRFPILTGDGFAEPWRFTLQGKRAAEHVKALRNVMLDTYPEALKKLAELLDEDEDPKPMLDYILGVASLEGRVFTGMSVAEACGFGYDDELEEVFDELVEAGLLINEPNGAVRVPSKTGIQWLYRYRFALPSWWFLFHEQWSIDERVEMAHALAAALERCYGRYAWHRANIIIELWEQAGHTSLARTRQPLFDRLAHIGALEAQARELELRAHQHGTWLEAHQAWLNVANSMWESLDDDIVFATFEQARMLAEQAKSPIAIAKTLENMANKANLHFKGRQAEQWAREGLSIIAPYKDTEAQRLRGRIYHEIGMVYELQKQWEKALEYLEQARALEETFGKSSNLAVTLHGIGLVYMGQERWGKALEYLEQARVIKEVHEERVDVATILHMIGEVHQGQKQWEKALEYLEQARAIKETLGRPLNLAKTLHAIGVVYEGQEQWEKALEYLEQARVLKEMYGEGIDLGATLHAIGVVYESQKQWEKALECLEQARALEEAYRGLSDSAKTLHAIGRVYVELEHWGEALEYLEQARVLRETNGKPTDLAMTLRWMGYVYYNQEQWADALQHFEQARDLEEAYGEPTDLANTLYGIGSVYQAQEQWADALRYFEQAVLLNEAHGELVELAKALHRIGQVYEAKGDLDQATDFFDQAGKVQKTPDSSAVDPYLGRQT